MKTAYLCSHSTTSFFGEVSLAFVNFFEGFVENEPMNQWKLWVTSCGFIFSMMSFYSDTFPMENNNNNKKKKSKLCFDFSVISDFIFARHVSIIQQQIADHLYLKQTLCLEHILWLCWRVPDENIFEILELHSAFSGS